MCRQRNPHTHTHRHKKHLNRQLRFCWRSLKMIKEARLQWFSNDPGDTSTTDTSSRENYFIVPWDTWQFNRQRDSKEQQNGTDITANTKPAETPIELQSECHEDMEMDSAGRWVRNKEDGRYMEGDIHKETVGFAKSQKVRPHRNNPSQHRWEYGPRATHTSCIPVWKLLMQRFS